MKKNILLVHIFLFMCQSSFAQEVRSYMQLGYNGDLFIGKNSFMGNGMKLGYQYNFLNDKSFLRLNSSVTFGNGRNSEFTYILYTGDPLVMKSDYNAVRFALTASFHQFIKGDLTDKGFYLNFGAGMLVHDLELYDTQVTLSNGGTTINNILPTDMTYLMFTPHIGAGYYYYLSDRLNLFADLNLYLPLGKDSKELREANTPLGVVFPSFTLGIVFQINIFGRYFYF